MKNTQIKGTSYGQIVNNNVDSHVKSNQEKFTFTLESGKNAMTLQGGKEYPMMFKEVLAGEYIKEWKVDNITRIITPLVPTLDKVFVTIKAFFVPHTRVWKSAEKFLANKSSQGNLYIDNKYDIPNYTIPVAQTQYDMYRNTLAARYGLANSSADTKINLLLLRGYRAIINDFVINKEYETPTIEWNDDTPTVTEQTAVDGYNTTTGARTLYAYYVEASQTRKGYLTNIFKSPNASLPVLSSFANGTNSDAAQHLSWEQRYKQAKQSVLNANKNDWDIIAEMGGTEPVINDRVQLLGELDYELNYQQITQSAPEIDNSSPLGTTGSFSYTRADGTLFSHKSFQQHGFIHVLITVQIDKGYEEGTPKELLKSKVDEIYTPSLAKKEIQLIRSAEIVNVSGVTVGETAAYQPPWAEYKRLPRLITGDMRTKKLTKIGTNPDPQTLSHWHNVPSGNVDQTISGGYFRPQTDVNLVLQRNNVLTYVNPASDVAIEMIANMSEHKVTISTPIEAETIHDVETANEQR